MFLHAAATNISLSRAISASLALISARSRSVVILMQLIEGTKQKYDSDVFALFTSQKINIINSIYGRTEMIFV